MFARVLSRLSIRWTISAAALLFSAASSFSGPPGEVKRLVFQGDKRTLSWSPLPEASSYCVYMGTTPAAYDHVCRTAGPAPFADIPDAPSGPGRLLYFLVSAVGSGGEGTLGASSDGQARPNLAPCDSDGDLIPNGIDDCPFVYNPPQLDQDGDGEGDRCDPETYDFEADIVGQRPGEMASVGGVDPTFTVRDLSGDLGVAYNESVGGVHDVFDRLAAGLPFQDTTLYVDLENIGETCSFELWSEGAFAWNAGSGIIVQIFATGQILFYERKGQSVPQVQGPFLPATGRLRLRLLKGAGTTSALHVDGFDGTAWQDDLFIYNIADDHLYRGRNTVIANYLGGRRGVKRVTVNHEIPQAAFILQKDPAWSSDWKVFQRDGNGIATIPVRFYYRLGEPGRVRARVVDSVTRVPLPGHDENDHEKALAAGAFERGYAAVESLDIQGVPIGGNYDVEVRLYRDSDGALLGGGFIGSVAVGDVYISGGQSNMSGYSGTLAGAEIPLDQVHLFHNDGTWKRATEPMDDGTDQVDLVSYETPIHSLMLRFAKDVYLATGVPVGVIPGPLGGTNLFQQWQRDEADHDNRGTLYGSMLHRALLQGYPTPCKGFLWFQGESDALSQRGTALYRADLERLVAEYREDLGNPGLYFLCAQLGVYTGSDLVQWTAIQEAEREAVLADSHSALVTTIDQPLSDVIHFSVDGYKTIGARFAEAARELVYGRPLDALVDLTEAKLNGTQAIDLTYQAAIAGGAPDLYQVTDDLGTVTPTSVSVAGNVVTLQIGRSLSGTITVSYGFSHDPAASWVKDLRGTPVALFANVPVKP